MICQVFSIFNVDFKKKGEKKKQKLCKEKHKKIIFSLSLASFFIFLSFLLFECHQRSSVWHAIRSFVHITKVKRKKFLRFFSCLRKIYICSMINRLGSYGRFGGLFGFNAINEEHVSSWSMRGST